MLQFDKKMPHPALNKVGQIPSANGTLQLWFPALRLMPKVISRTDSGFDTSSFACKGNMVS